MLTINEIYCSIQGESTFAGRPCTFVRLTACDLRCAWCDTPYAFHEGHKQSVEDVVTRIQQLGCPLVEITGGEPLLQEDVYLLMERLQRHGLTVLLETGGHLSVARVPGGVIKIVDIKCPASGQAHRNEWTNLQRLGSTDEVKFVMADRADYEFAREVLGRYGLDGRVAAVHFSPVHGVLDPKVLASWLIDDRLPVRLQLQLHKYIWAAGLRGV